MIAVFSNVKTDSTRLDRGMICNPAPADIFVVLNAEDYGIYRAAVEQRAFLGDTPSS
jgi:hypothetical protein